MTWYCDKPPPIVVDVVDVVEVDEVVVVDDVVVGGVVVVVDEVVVEPMGTMLVTSTTGSGTIGSGAVVEASITVTVKSAAVGMLADSNTQVLSSDGIGKPNSATKPTFSSDLASMSFAVKSTDGANDDVQSTISALPTKSPPV